MKIVITDFAKDELKDIYSFYKEKASKRIADKLRDNIVSAIKNLQQNPLSGQIEENLHSLNAGHRRLIEGNYKIIYRIEEEYIYITDIFDTRRNPEKMKG